MSACPDTFSLLMKASSSGEDLTFLTRSDTTVYVPHKVSGKQRGDAGSLACKSFHAAEWPSHQLQRGHSRSWWIKLPLWRSELYLVQGQHVEVADVVLLGVSDPGPALLLVDHLPDVLAHKLTLGRKNTRYVTRAHLVVAF